MAKAGTKVTVVMSEPKVKKAVTRFDSDDEALSNAYIGNEALKKLGNPKRVKVTIEAA